MQRSQKPPGQPAVHAGVGAAVGVAGGLIGLGGAELRLPYLVGVLKLTAHQAVAVNLAVSFGTILAAIPARWIGLTEAPSASSWTIALAVAVGAVTGAWLGSRWLARLSSKTLTQLIAALLVALGLLLLVESQIPLVSDGVMPADTTIRTLGGAAAGVLVGTVSSLLGVAGGELLIPLFVFGFGIPVKLAGSLSLAVSLPTVSVGLWRNWRAGRLGNRAFWRGLILPMTVGAMLGAALGGQLVGLVDAELLKVALGLLLIWSSWKVLSHGSR
ncbi:MAG: sulfite exporter TauE/SafE family protein [Bdellovibrionales bacterium]|nr:sulfite exporter TauE/SafE family protein [Bdellovibrionales bacterium]